MLWIFKNILYKEKEDNQVIIYLVIHTIVVKYIKYFFLVKMLRIVQSKGTVWFSSPVQTFTSATTTSQTYPQQAADTYNVLMRSPAEEAVVAIN